MKRLITVLLILLTVLSLGGVVGYSIHRARSTGGEAPMIYFDEDQIDVTTDAADEVLLEGVTARDREDGDVTESLMVEGVSNMQKGTVTVTYVAFDAQGHVARASREARYTDYTSPKFTMSRPMVFASNGVNDLMDGVGAKDCIDGNISAAVRASYTDQSSSLTSAGEHMVELRVTNSLGETVRLNVPVRVQAESPRSDQLPLTAYLVYLDQNSSFDPLTYLSADMAEAAQREGTDRLTVQIQSNVDLSKPGVYAVDYTSARNEQTVATTRLIVVVE